MARTAARPQPTRSEHRQPWFSHCTQCGQRLGADYKNRRTVATLAGLLRLTLDIRRCHNRHGQRYRKPYRPEAEGYYALPQQEFGLDVIALVGNLREGEHRSTPEIHQALRHCGLDIAPRTVTNLLDRYDERSYWAGLFYCYEVVDLPRTNNALEQFFGSHRYHARRASGRKGASPGLVLRGQARLLAAAATRQRVFRASELAGADRGQREELRRPMEARRQRRVQRRRFRRDPQAYLQALEEQLLQSTLPS